MGHDRRSRQVHRQPDHQQHDIQNHRHPKRRQRAVHPSVAHRDQQRPNQRTDAVERIHTIQLAAGIAFVTHLRADQRNETHLRARLTESKQKRRQQHHPKRRRSDEHHQADDDACRSTQQWAQAGVAAK